MHQLESNGRMRQRSNVQKIKRADIACTLAIATRFRLHVSGKSTVKAMGEVTNSSQQISNVHTLLEQTFRLLVSGESTVKAMGDCTNSSLSQGSLVVNPQ
jgi:hypothetical protein